MGQDGYGKFTGASGAGAAAFFFVWAWNSFLPSHAMPAEMAAALAVAFAALGAYVVPHTAVGGKS